MEKTNRLINYLSKTIINERQADLYFQEEVSFKVLADRGNWLNSLTFKKKIYQ